MLVKFWAWGLMGLLASCASAPGSDDASTDRARAFEPAADQESLAAFKPFPSIGAHHQQAPTDARASDWRHHPLPGKQPTRYAYEWLDKRHTVSARASASASVVRHPLRVESSKLKKISFSWKVPQLISGADLAQREAHDSPVRLALAFDGDRSRFSTKNALLSELARTLTGEPLPYATLMYVWCNACAPGSLLVNPRTDRIREIAVESGPGNLGQWQDYQRDIHADYLRAFGEPPGALVDVGLMTDTDNTRQRTTAWYGPVSLSN